MRATTRRHVRIARPADAVWSVIGRPELLHLWFPGIVDCAVEGDRRDVTVATGVTMTEQIVTNDPVLRRFQYRLEGPLFHDHLASIDVIDLEDGTCVAVYATDADPATMALVLGGAAGAALEELRRQVEAGTGPAVDAADHLAGHHLAGPAGHDPAGHDPAGNDLAGNDLAGNDLAGNDPAEGEGDANRG